MSISIPGAVILSSAPTGTEAGLAVRQVGAIPALPTGTNTIGGVNLVGNTLGTQNSYTLSANTAPPTPNTANATNSVATTNVSTAGNATITVSGTFTGNPVVVFEQSDDSGTTWFPLQCVRSDNGQVYTTDTFAAGALRVYDTAAEGITHIRVRMTTATGSGALTVRTTPGPTLIEPSVSAYIQNPPRTSLVFATASAGVLAGATATENLLTLAQNQRGFAAVGSGSSFALTAGKTFRIQALTVGMKLGAGTVGSCIFNVRYNPAGAVTAATAGIVAQVPLIPSAATSGFGTQVTVSFPDGKDLQAGYTPGQVGVSIYPVWTTTAPTVWCGVEGYEY